MPPFALNHMAAPRLGWEAFLDLSARLGCMGVEFRNDLPGALFQGADPSVVGVACRARGLRFLALAEVKMFNDWSDAKRAEAAALMQIAVTAGAEAVSLIPRNDGVDTGEVARKAAMTTALRELLPMLRGHGLRGMVEPLGFEVCSLRYKSELVDVIESLGAADTYAMVHDTFHHHLAGGGPVFPAHTGIVHVSGVTDPGISVADMRDGHRVLVDRHDRLGNVAQIAALRDAGYAGPISFEPFAAAVHALDDAGPALRESMEFITDGLAAKGA
ncbi:TIM barrel protein [Fertoebacter nigrum]|uniref:TIM barrel protein n=1 Tax=Fertoeibacter niger TaxID=2656921 RepID=A0A8X8H4M9_9RHOB|nr:TIM barrel protein [Fertoeibacter niger]NUB46277.1 TIM barrel protein [Fertoeibacter niger]